MGGPVDDSAGHLDLDVAFDAMVRFLENWWERGGRPNGDVLWLLSACNREMTRDGGPVDQAMWEDWKQAVAEVCAERGSTKH